MELVQEFLEKTADRTPDKVALICGGSQWRYQDLETEANQLSHRLTAIGFKPGDRAVLYLDNSAALVTAIFAVLKAGGVFVLANPMTKAERLRYLVSDAEASLLVGESAYLKKSFDALEGIQCLKNVIVHGPSDTSQRATWLTKFDGSVVPWSEALDGPASRPKRRRIDVDLAALIYTSGSTGNPKGVMLSHRNIVCAADSIITYLGLEQDDVILNALPMSFDYGLYQMLMACKQGATLVLETSFAFPHATLCQIPRHQVTIFPLVPTMSAMLLGLDLMGYDVKSLKTITNTGAALPVQHILRWQEIWPHVSIFAMYGLTECKRVSYLPPEDLNRKLGSVGIPIPNTEVFIMGKAGESLPPHAVGELVVRGGHVMQGYWRADDLTERKLRPGTLPGERLLYTGNLFRCDEDGYLYFEGRTDDMIKCRGEKVSPLEIEEALYRQKQVSEAAVVGVPDPYFGEVVVAFVAPTAGASLDKNSILRELKLVIEDYKIPSKLYIMPVLPKTPNGKIDKKSLKTATEELGCKHLAGMF